MNTALFVSLSWRPRRAAFVGGVFLFVLSVHSLYAAEPSTGTLELRHANGLIDAHLEQVPLGEVLQLLVRETGIEVHSLDPHIMSWRVSLTLQSVPVDEAIKAILDGFSYALHACPNKHEVIVASTRPRAAGTGIKKSGGERTLAALGHGGAKQGKDVPQTLDDFQPISEVALSYVDGGQEGDSSARSASGQEYNEALLERALTALGSQHRNLYEQAIDELAALQDPRAVEALAQAVLPDAGLDADTRERAASALSQQVINSRFSDPVSVEPMQQLAKDRNEIVRGIAVNTLQEMQKYEKSRFSGHVKFY